MKAIYSSYILLICQEKWLNFQSGTSRGRSNLAAIFEMCYSVDCTLLDFIVKSVYWKHIVTQEKSRDSNLIYFHAFTYYLKNSICFNYANKSFCNS